MTLLYLFCIDFFKKPPLVFDILGGSELHPVNGSYDEKGYVAIPPCLWGSTQYGLEPAPLLTWDTNLTSIKQNNNTYVLRRRWRNTKGHSSSYLAMGFANVRAGTRYPPEH